MFFNRKKNEDSDFTDFIIESGPRVKTLATQHLEYIIYGLLDKKSQVEFKQEDKSKEIVATVNGKQFSLTAILRARPDFEQFTFYNAQLDLYVENRKQTNQWRPPFIKKAHLHQGEIAAIRDWTTYSVDNLFLRSGISWYSQNKDFSKAFLSICIASHGLSKPLFSANQCVTRSYRGENFDTSNFLKERITRSDNKQLTTNKGFTASSGGWLYFNREIYTEFK